MRSSLVLVFSSLIASITAQSNYTFPSGFNLALVSESNRNAWCLAERNTCPQICDGAALPNNCDPDTLTFSCTCINGTVPDVSLYQNTIPFFVCQANYAQCINNNPTDREAQEQCKANATCGTLNATETVSSASTTSAAVSTTLSTASSTATASQTGSTTSTSATTATSSGAAMALQVAQDHSTSLFMVILLGVFGLIL